MNRGSPRSPTYRRDGRPRRRTRRRRNVPGRAPNGSVGRTRRGHGSPPAARAEAVRRGARRSLPQGGHRAALRTARRRCGSTTASTCSSSRSATSGAGTGCSSRRAASPEPTVSDSTRSGSSPAGAGSRSTRGCRPARACGRSSRHRPLTYVGKYQGASPRRASRALDGGQLRCRPRVVFTDPQAASVGDARGRCRRRSRSPRCPGRRPTREYAESPGFMTLISDGERLTGAHALGPDAGGVAAAGDGRDPGRDSARGAARHDPAVPDLLRDLPPRVPAARRSSARNRVTGAHGPTTTHRHEFCFRIGGWPDPAARFPDFRLSNHAGNERRLSDLVGGDPTRSNQFLRGWWCSKEQEFFRRMLREGVLGVAHPPVGPVNERYGSANLWPGTASRGKNHERRRYRVKRAGVQRAGRARHRLSRGTAARPRRGAARGPPLHLRRAAATTSTRCGRRSTRSDTFEEPLAPEVREELLEAFGWRGK